MNATLASLFSSITRDMEILALRAITHVVLSLRQVKPVSRRVLGYGMLAFSAGTALGAALALVAARI
ncbi:hypothetical protein LBMAG37_13590 [Anaerolineae bacterium]|nr:hypothetical protein EMGBS3_11450 [Anaerolineaceae bacterium]GBL36752.1 hypothetical protein EMGBD1_04390 [Anaerolineaceae bacterium]GDX68204.1 hypothetical protein LBMAG37_13590 [Anaerolineae bacterium]